jgi:excisionase family DNA binding protein
MTHDMGSDQIVARPSAAKRPLLRISELAEVLGISRRQAYAWVAAGVIPREAVARAGRAVYVKRLALEEWLAGRDDAEPTDSLTKVICPALKT